MDPKQRARELVTRGTLSRNQRDRARYLPPLCLEFALNSADPSTTINMLPARRSAKAILCRGKDLDTHQTSEGVSLMFSALFMIIIYVAADIAIGAAADRRCHRKGVAGL